MPRPAQRTPPPPNSAGAERRGGGGIADAHLAEAQQIGARLDGIVPGGDGGEECGLVHRRRGGEVGRRAVEVERHDVQPRARDALQAG